MVVVVAVAVAVVMTAVMTAAWLWAVEALVDCCQCGCECVFIIELLKNFPFRGSTAK